MAHCSSQSAKTNDESFGIIFIKNSIVCILWQKTGK